MNVRFYRPRFAPMVGLVVAHGVEGFRAWTFRAMFWWFEFELELGPRVLR